MTESALSYVLLGVDWYADPNVERINHYHLLDRRRIDRLRAMSILVARPASLINQESMKNQITIDGIDWEMAEQRPLSQTVKRSSLIPRNTRSNDHSYRLETYSY